MTFFVSFYIREQAKLTKRSNASRNQHYSVTMIFYKPQFVFMCIQIEFQSWLLKTVVFSKHNVETFRFKSFFKLPSQFCTWEI